jgi:hypothetical protein
LVLQFCTCVHAVLYVLSLMDSNKRERKKFDFLVYHKRTILGFEWTSSGWLPHVRSCCARRRAILVVRHGGKVSNGQELELVNRVVVCFLAFLRWADLVATKEIMVHFGASVLHVFACCLVCFVPYGFKPTWVHKVWLSGQSQANHTWLWKNKIDDSLRTFTLRETAWHTCRKTHRKGY